MNFQILGSVDVFEDGRRLPLGGPKQRLVLAQLLIRANSVVAADTLIEEIWGDRPPDAAKSALQAYVSRLRKSLGPGRLEGRPPGYLLHAEPDEVDAVRFEQLVRQARERLVRDPKGAADLLDQAFSLWKGTPLAGLADEPSLRPEVSRLEELHLVATEDRNEAAFALGRQPDIAELERLVDRYPLRERFWGQFMLALYRSGRQAEALDVYRRARDLLAEELGIDPSPELKRLHERVLRQDPVLELRGEPLRGYRLLEKVGEGAFGVVHRAAQPQLNREVAVKVIHPRWANNPEFIRRFEFEAQLVARLENPRIVPLYDYWRDAGGAYLVMRFLKGGSLRQRLTAGPLESQEALRIMEQVAEALDAAHRANVVHRDVKPENVLFDGEGNAYLTDFGIAKELSGPGLTKTGVVLTPGYLSPEQIRGEPPIPATDVYSLGLLLYEVLTAKEPFRAEFEAAQPWKRLEEPVPSVGQARPELPPAVDEVIARAASKDPAHRYPDAPALATAFRAALGAGASRLPVAAETRNPYKGLRPFLEADAADFFGRERTSEQLIARMSEPGEASRFLAVVGPSGGGKSSLVRAGLLPALRNGAVPGSDRWFVVEMFPGAYPFEELEAALLKLAVNPPASLMEQLERDEHGLLRAARRVLPADDSELLIVVDQFEELFTLVQDEARRARFMATLHAAVADPRSRVRVVITLRADFYDRPLMYSGFGGLLAARTQAVSPLSAEELERAISAPGDRMGVSLEPRLVGEIVAEVLDRAGALPLLQYALTELFERRQGTVVPASAYREIGGVTGALARRAEALYDHLSPTGREAARQLFLRLVTVGEEGADGTRRRVLRAELGSLEVDRNAMEAVIDAFGGHRLLSFDRDPVTRGPTVEVAHEALLREWSRLRGWIEGAREDVRMYRRLDAAAAEWVRSGEDPSFLPGGGRLIHFGAWAGTTDVALSDLERRYLDAGVARRDAEADEEEARKAREAELERRSMHRLRALVAVLTVLAVVASVLSVVAVGERGRARREAGAAEREARVAAARELASAAVANLEVDPERSILLALQAVATTKEDGIALPEAVEALHGAVQADRQILTLRDPSTANVDWSPDGRVIATGGSAGGNGRDDVILWDARTGVRLLTLKGHTADIGYVAFSPDSSRLATMASDDLVIVWDARTGKRLLDVPEEGIMFSGLSFSPDGSRLVMSQSNASDTAGTVQVLDATTGASLQRINVDGGICQAPVYSPDGTLIAAPGDHVSIYDATTGEETLRLDTSTCQVVFSPDGTEVATGGAFFGGPPMIWDARTGRLLETLRGFAGPEPPIDWSRDGTRIATGGNDGAARIWDATTGEQLLVLTGHAGVVAGVDFSPDGTKLLTGGGDGTARVWDITPASTAEALGAAESDALTSVAYSPDGSSLMTTGLSPEGGWLWDGSSGERIRSIPHAWFDSAFSGDGSTIATRGDTLAIMDPSSGAVLRTLHPDGRNLNGIAYASGAPLVVAGVDNGSGAGTVRLWDASSGKLIRTFGEPSPVGMQDAAISPDGRVVAGLSWFAMLRVWDVSGQELFRVQASLGEGRSLAFSPDGTMLATSGGDGAVLWSIPSGKRIASLPGAGSTGVVAFSPDGKLVATGGDDGAARIWDVGTGRLALTLTGHTDAISGVAFSPDGTRLATVGQDGTLRVYVLPLSQLVMIARIRLTRGFTQAECLQYLHVPTCPDSAPSPELTPAPATSPPLSEPIAPEGAFRTSIVRSNLEALGIPRGEWPHDLGDYTLSIMAGRWHVHQDLPDGTMRDRSGTYTASAGRVTFTVLDDASCFGGAWSANWSLGPTALSFTHVSWNVPQACEPEVFQARWRALFGSQPLSRVT
jgi:WD40 repeat protein/serine/threonine protein kinase